MVLLHPKIQSKVKVNKTKTTDKSKLEIPTKWADFARCCVIRSGSKIVNFDPYPYQVLLSDLIDCHYGTVIAKTRQLGITEAIACKFLHKACKNIGYVAVILSKSQTDSSNIAKRIRKMVDGLSDYVELATDNLTDLQIKNGGRILFRPSTPNGTRGLESISDILFDEASFVDDIERLYTSAVPATEMVGDDARLIILSTPNGKSGFYWDRLVSGNPKDKDVESICNQIKNKQVNPVQHWVDNNGWCKFITHWLAHPTYSQIPDYLEQIKIKKQLSESAIQQEYNLSFSESEVNVFPSDLVRANALGAYKDPESWSQYYIGIDTATTGDDYTTGIVLKYSSPLLFVVAIFRERKHSMDYNLEHLGNLIKNYNPVKVGIEVTGGTGQIYLEQLSKKYSTEFEGIKTTNDTKTAMIDRLLLCLEKREIYYPPDCPVVEELMTFRRSGKKLGAPSGKHDDTVMALAFGIAVSPFNKGGYDLSWLNNI